MTLIVIDITTNSISRYLITSYNTVPTKGSKRGLGPSIKRTITVAKIIEGNVDRRSLL